MYKISIITPVLNNVKDIKNCLDSVINQTYDNIEHIIVDGVSMDGTLEIIREYAAAFPQIKYISENDKGIYDAMNKGIDRSTGDYLLFLGADDVFYDKNILKDILSAEGVTDYDFIYGKSLFKKKQIVYGKQANLNTLKTENISHQAILYKKQLFQKLGKYGNTFKVSEDYIFNIKCFKDEHVKKKFVDKIIVIFNDTATSSIFRDGFQKHRLFYFDDLTLTEKFKKIYFYYRPDWFIPSKLFHLNAEKK